MAASKVSIVIKWPLSTCIYMYHANTSITFQYGIKTLSTEHKLICRVTYLKLRVYVCAYVVGAWKSSLLAKGLPTLNKIPNLNPEFKYYLVTNTHLKTWV